MEDIKNLVEKIKKKNDAKQKLNDYKWDEEFNFLIDSSDEEYKEKQKLEKELNEKDYPIFYKKHMKTIEKISELFFGTLEFSFEEIIEEVKLLKQKNRILEKQNIDLKNKIKRLNTKNKK
jgi:hypothetical protein